MDRYPASRPDLQRALCNELLATCGRKEITMGGRPKPSVARRGAQSADAGTTATGTIAPPGGGDAPKSHRGQLAWWRLRSWRKDVDVLARVRDGLQNLPDNADEDDAPASESELARPSESMPQGASAEAPSPSADPAIAAIRHTFASVAAAGDDAAAFFYARLFVRSPELRELFPPAMDEQRDRLFRALARIVESLSSPEELASYLTQLGRDHRKY